MIQTMFRHLALWIAGASIARRGGKLKFAFIEGPDKMRIEVIEGQAHKE